MPSESTEPSSSRKAGPSRRTGDPMDVVALLRSGHITGSIKPRESPAERKSRLGIEEAKAGHLLWKEKMILVATLLGLASIVILCFIIALRSEPSEDKKWAMSVLAAIVSGGVGYLARGAANKPD